MDIDWKKYQNKYRYRLRVSLYFLERQSENLKKRVFRAAKRCIARNVLLLLVVFGVLWLVSAPAGTYGIALVGLGATILAWTAFRVHEKAFREAALVPDERKGDTPHQERVSMTATNYVDSAVGVLLVVLGFTVRTVTSLG
jgi:hypothetical protein